jgi:hypothetical protein
VLSPRRVEDFQNLKHERADSALDHRHRFVTSGIYDLPFFTKSSNWAARTLLGGFTVSATLTFESGERAGIRSGVDSNQNGDNAGDRAIINLSGTPGTATTVRAIGRNGATIPFTLPDGSANPALANTVAYVANDPNAQYVQAQVWALTTAGRNTLQMPGINNLDFSIFKNFAIREKVKMQLRADLFNAFNHAQFVPGSVNGVEATAQTSAAVTNLITIANNNTLFNRPDRVFSSHPRVIQMALRLNF